jgi:OCT family organic cation transporter-like MFS transporter 18
VGSSQSDLTRVARLPGVSSLLAVKFLTGMASAVFQSAFPLFVSSHFGLDARGSGLVMSFTGCVGIATQALAVGAATRRLDDRRIVSLSALAMLGSLAGLACVTQVSHLCVLLVPLYVAYALLSTVNTAQLTKAAPADAGTITAIDMSVGSCTRMLSPSIATYTLQQAGYSAVCGLSASTLALLLLLLRVRALDAAPHAAPKAQ